MKVFAMVAALVGSAAAFSPTPRPARTARTAAATACHTRRLPPPRLDEAATEARLASLEATVARLEAQVAVMAGETEEPPSGSDESGEDWLIDDAKVYKTSDGKAKGISGFVNKRSGYAKDKGSVGALLGNALYVPAGLALLALVFGGQIADYLDASGAIGQPTIFSPK